MEQKPFLTQFEQDVDESEQDELATDVLLQVAQHCCSINDLYTELVQRYAFGTQLVAMSEQLEVELDVVEHVPQVRAQLACISK